MRSHNRLYTLLGVLPDADPVVIEAAYKALMKRHHPDIHAGGIAVGERIAADLNQAYQTLRDPDRRAAYDADQRAREERRKAELARALQPPGARIAQPPPRPEPARAGQRAAAWIGAAGLLALGGAIYLFSQGVEPARTRVVTIEAEAVAPAAREAEQAFRDQPVSRDEVTRAIARFRQVAGETGLPGAAGYSQACFDGQSRTRAISSFDHCVAFDHVAGRAEASTPERRELQFQPQSLVMRHIRAAERIVRDPSLIEARLFEIRRLADNELERLASAAPARPAAAAKPAAARIAAAGAAVPKNVPRPARPAPRRSPAPEQDFLERQGGIY